MGEANQKKNKGIQSINHRAYEGKVMRGPVGLACAAAQRVAACPILCVGRLGFDFAVRSDRLGLDLVASVTSRLGVSDLGEASWESWQMCALCPMGMVALRAKKAPTQFGYVQFVYYY